MPLIKPAFEDIGEISDEEWRMTFDVNIHAMFYLAKAAVPHMKPGSAIINTASVNADMPNPTLLAYATTKGAIQKLHRRSRANVGGQGSARECGRPRADLDPPDSFYDAGRNGEKFWKTGPVKTGWAAGGTGHGIRNVGRSTLELYIGNDGRGHRGKALHIMKGGLP